MPITRRLTLVAALALTAGSATAATKAETPKADAAKPDAAKKVGTETITVPSADAAPEIHKGTEDLPKLVAGMRQRILGAAYSGEMARLKVVMQQSETPPVLAVNEVGDAIEYLKSQSGDGEGREILAIITDLLESGWSRINPGKPNEMYVWPYFATRPIDGLQPDQLVELFKIVTSGDYEEMKPAGKYTFYSIGIGPDGTWHYFKLAD